MADFLAEFIINLAFYTIQLIRKLSKPIHIKGKEKGELEKRLIAKLKKDGWLNDKE